MTLITEKYGDRFNNEYPDYDALKVVQNRDTMPFEVDFFIFIDESDASEWIVFGCGRTELDEILGIDLDVVKERMAKETGLIATDQIFTVAKGGHINFSRAIPAKGRTVEEFKDKFQYTCNLLMKVER